MLFGARFVFAVHGCGNELDMGVCFQLERDRAIARGFKKFDRFEFVGFEPHCVVASSFLAFLGTNDCILVEDYL